MALLRLLYSMYSKVCLQSMMYFELLLSPNTWRRAVLSAARDLVDRYRLGHISYRAANSALGRGETAPFTATIRIVDGEDANVVALGTLYGHLSNSGMVTTTSYLLPMWRPVLQRMIGIRHGSMLFVSVTVSWR
jgi:hypothetical protein